MDVKEYWSKQAKADIEAMILGSKSVPKSE
jgi:hypothetical protein